MVSTCQVAALPRSLRRDVEAGVRNRDRSRTKWLGCMRSPTNLPGLVIVMVLVPCATVLRRLSLQSHGSHWAFTAQRIPRGGLLGERNAASLATQLHARFNRNTETEEERLKLDKEARDGMEEYMVKIEDLAAKGNVRAQKTAWKWKVRKKVWNYLEDNDLADFPRPVHHRIPNFKGSAETGRRIKSLPEFQSAKVVKVNPDTPQKSVRVSVLEDQKTL
eukprot:TRINITY_DN47404_c0_g1_i2.p1 TRINITY_DN47404_c0_g1~~TRINITY_DN47404_c0_g1_i2.p1  ORF type:complete len:219 (+),score=12.43 TRINITY_DN47404_c0_g1_i2:56-712(+)